MKHIATINGSPRLKWNTATLVSEAARGAEAAGAEIQHFDLYRLERYTGCISCFGCKRLPNEGRCIYRDGLTPVLDAIREADGVITGTPNYLSDVSAAFRSLYERLIFQPITYQRERWSYNTRPVPVLLIMTSNSPEEGYAEGQPYGQMIEGYRRSLSGLVGPTKLLIAGNTLQVSDYSRYNWTVFDPAAKQTRHDEVFPREKKRAFELGKCLVESPWQE